MDEDKKHECEGADCDHSEHEETEMDADGGEEEKEEE